MAEAFNINNSDIVRYTDALERAHRSSLPVAIRTSLNDAAFDSKKNEIEKAFKKQFTVRKPTFIRAHTQANKSINTFDINKMQSSIGVIKGKSTAGDQLKIQEFGGTINNRENIPTPAARTSRSSAKLVSKRNYLNRVKPKNKKPITKPSNLLKAAHHHGKGSILLYGKVMIRIKNILKRGYVKYTKLYAVDEGRNVRIEKSPFVSVAAMKSSKKIPTFYAENAAKQIKKNLQRK